MVTLHSTVVLLWEVDFFELYYLEKSLHSTVVLLWVILDSLFRYLQSSFTFHCGSIMGFFPFKILCTLSYLYIPLWFYYGFYKNNIKIQIAASLHSTVVLLWVAQAEVAETDYTTLHSTVVLLWANPSLLVNI